MFFFKNKIKPPHTKAGLSMIELAIALGVMGAVLGALWVGVGNVWLNYNVYRTQNQVREMVQNFREIYGVRPWRAAWNPGANMTNDLRGAAPNFEDSIYPLDVSARTAGSPVMHAFGGPVVITSVMNPQGGRGIRLQLSQLSQSACIQFLVKTPVLVKEVGIFRIAGTNGFRDINPTNTGGLGSVTLGEATAWCNNAGTANNVQIDFKALN